MQFVTISVRRGVYLRRGAVCALLARYLRRRARCWEGLYIDVFTGGGTLYLIRPAAWVADYALPIIHNKFTE